MGIVQWAIADELDALAPSVTASQFRGMALRRRQHLARARRCRGCSSLEVQERRLAPLLLAHGLRRTLPGLYAAQVPIAELDERAFGARIPYFREWMEEMSPDSPYWAARDFSSSVGDVEAPVQLIGGWYDIFLPWMVEDYRALRAAGRRPQLIIGPWTHTSPALAGVSLREGIAWMRAHLLGDPRMRARRAGARLRDRRAALARASRMAAAGRARAHVPPAARRCALGRRRRRTRPRRAATATTRPTRRRRSAARCCSSGSPSATTAARGTRGRARPSRPRRSTSDLDALGPVHADIRLRSSRDDTDVFVRVCDVEPGRSVAERLRRADPADRRPAARATATASPRCASSSGRLPTASPPATASACRSRAARTHATRATRAPARTRCGRPASSPPTRRSSTIPRGHRRWSCPS